MFNLFKKAKQQEIITEVTVLEQSTAGEYSPEIEIIHNEFFTASDVAYKQAMKIINEKSHLKEKAKKLQELGFTQVKEVKEVEELNINQEIVNSIQDYKVRYPNNKFITYYQVEQICKKYGLILGPVDKYIGFVPAVKLEQIALFKLQEQDKCEYEIYSDNGEMLGYVTEDQIKPNIIRYLSKSSFTYTEFTSGEINVDGGYAKWGKFSQVRKATQSLMICAPAKDFNTKGMQLKDYKLLNIPDPIVLKPVKNGYLILAAWGPEQSDPLVVNETMN